MPVEKSIGAIIFKKEREELKFLLLHYSGRTRKAKTYWDFPKGHTKQGESEIDTLRREVEEETRINDLKIIPDFKETVEYFFKKDENTVFKKVIFYLTETGSKEIKISSEHIGFKWLPFKQALEQLTFKNAKEIFQKAYQYLQ